MRKDTDEVRLSWLSRPNVTYTLEWAETLDGEWNVLTTVEGTGTTVVADDFTTAEQRFYRTAAAQ